MTPTTSERKRELPAFTVNGVARDRKTLLKHSGLIQGDLDHLNGEVDRVRTLLVDDPHIAFGFLSPSGAGIKLGVCVDPSVDHKLNFLTVER